MILIIGRLDRCRHPYGLCLGCACEPRSHPVCSFGQIQFGSKTPLHMAAMKDAEEAIAAKENAEEVIAALIDAGADVHCKDVRGYGGGGRWGRGGGGGGCVYACRCVGRESEGAEGEDEEGESDTGNWQVRKV